MQLHFEIVRMQIENKMLTKNIPGPCISLRHNCIEEEKNGLHIVIIMDPGAACVQKNCSLHFRVAKLLTTHTPCSIPIARPNAFFSFLRILIGHIRERSCKNLLIRWWSVYKYGGCILAEAGIAKQEQPEWDEAHCVSPEKFAFRIMHKNYASLVDVDKYLIFSFFERARF